MQTCVMVKLRRCCHLYLLRVFAYRLFYRWSCLCDALDRCFVFLFRPDQLVITGLRSGPISFPQFPLTRTVMQHMFRSQFSSWPATQSSGGRDVAKASDTRCGNTCCHHSSFFFYQHPTPLPSPKPTLSTIDYLQVLLHYPLKDCWECL